MGVRILRAGDDNGNPPVADGHRVGEVVRLRTGGDRRYTVVGRVTTEFAFGARSVAYILEGVGHYSFERITLDAACVAVDEEPPAGDPAGAPFAPPSPLLTPGADYLPDRPSAGREQVAGGVFG